MSTFTYSYLDLPELPQSIIDAAWASIKQNKNNDEIKVNNWRDRPGYIEYEFRNFKQRNGKEVKTIKSNRYRISDEFDKWVRKYFNQDPTPCGVALYETHSSLFAPHVDISRDYTIMYILDTGGDNVETSWYRQHGRPLVRPDLKSVFDKDKIVHNYDELEEIDRVCFPAGKWVCINASIIHAAENITGTRVAIQISRNTPPEVGVTYISTHNNFL